MLNETNLFHKNLTTLRFLLTESVGQNIISDAIKDMRYVYLYYKGDGVESTGYRTVKPYIMGTRKNDGVMVFRGWQIEGDSDSQKRVVSSSGKPRSGHEFFMDNNLNKIVPGWREFRLDRVISVYPTTNTFKLDKLPPKYKGNLDKVISSVKTAIPKSYKPKKDAVIDVTAKKFLDDRRISDYIEWLFTDVTKRKHRSPSKTFVYVGDDGKIKFTYKEHVIEKIPNERVLGNLRELYNEYVLPKKTDGDNFLEKERRDSYRYKK